MELHLTLDRSRPLRVQLEQQLRDGIRTGRLQAGIRLPPTRVLAAELGVSRGVVVEAYAQLTAEGYLSTRGSGGTRVAAGPKMSARPRREARSNPIRFDLRSGLPDASLFPRRTWTAAMTTVLRSLPDAALLYGPPQGQRRLRDAVGAYLGRTRALTADEEQTFITCGASHGLSLLCRALQRAGVQRVAHEDPAWRQIPKTVAQAGMEPVPVRVDTSGLSVSDLYASDAQAAIVSPAHQYPTGVIMHPIRRAQLVRWAVETGGLIVEDDYDSEYRFGSPPLAPLRSTAPEQVAYVGTTSKVLAPGLRVGWMVVPARYAPAVAGAHAVSYAQPSLIDQATMAAMLENGDVDRHLRRTRSIYRSRRASLLSAMAQRGPALRVTGGAAGLHVLAWLPAHASETEVVARAAQSGVALDALHDCCAVSRALGPALVLGYGSIDASAIPRAVSLLSECLAQIAA